MALVELDWTTLGDGVALLRLNDPTRLNAMSVDMAESMREVIAQLLLKTDLRMVILTGTERAFSAGGDIEMLAKRCEVSAEQNRIFMRRYYNDFLALRTLGVPLIAAINGITVGAASALVCACDLRIATITSSMSFSFVRLGLHPGMGTTWFLPSVVGVARATELLLTARTLSSSEMIEYGLVSKVVPDQELMNAVEELVSVILKGGTECIKQLISTLRAPSSCLNQALERECLVQALNYSGAEFKTLLKEKIDKKPSLSKD
jgi:enoyl-CoA hydratase/carnithine racemase